MFLICSASKICSFCLLFWCPNIVVLSVRIFHNSTDNTTQQSYVTFVIDPPQMMAQSRAESTRDTYNYGQYINQFPLNMIKAIRQYERIQKKICRQKMSIMFNEICINKEMLPKFIYIYIYTHTHIYKVSQKCTHTLI